MQYMGVSPQGQEGLTMFRVVAGQTDCAQHGRRGGSVLPSGRSVAPVLTTPLVQEPGLGCVGRHWQPQPAFREIGLSYHQASRRGDSRAIGDPHKGAGPGSGLRSGGPVPGHTEF